MGDSTPPAYQLRTAQHADVDWLVDLRERTMNGYIRASGHELSADESQQRVLQDFEQIRIVQVGTRDVGMVKLLRGADPWKLVQIQMQASHQNMGLGTQIVRDLLGEARVAGVNVSLSVLKVNPARTLYERLGFRLTADKATSYEMTAQTGDFAPRR